MSSKATEDSSRSQTGPSKQPGDHPVLALVNPNINVTPTNLTRMETRQEPRKNINKIPTFVIWSIFNLLFVPLGVLCCFFSYKVSQLKVQARYEIAKKWSRRTFVLNIMTTLLMIGIIITVVMLHYDYTQRNPDMSGNITHTTGSYIPWQPGR